MNANLFELIWNNVAVIINTATAQMVAALMGWTRTNFPACALAYLVIMYLIAAWRSDPEAWQRFFRHCFLASVIWSLSTIGETFNYYVLGLVDGIVNSITTAIGGIFGAGAGPITALTFDHILIKTFAYGVQIFQHVGMTSPKSWLLGLLVLLYWFFSALGIFVIFVAFLAGSVVTHFVMAFGPLFIPLYFFTFTRRFFDGWVSVVVGGLLTQIFTVGWLAMFVSSLGTMLTQIQNAGGTADDIANQIITLILAWILIDTFATMTGISAYIAVRIASGAFTGLGSMPSAWTFNQPAADITPMPSMVGHGGSGLPGSAPAPGPSPNGAPVSTNRNYAFNRNVGSAP